MDGQTDTNTTHVYITTFWVNAYISIINSNQGPPVLYNSISLLSEIKIALMKCQVGVKRRGCMSGVEVALVWSRLCESGKGC